MLNCSAWRPTIGLLLGPGHIPGIPHNPGWEVSLLLHHSSGPSCCWTVCTPDDGRADWSDPSRMARAQVEWLNEWEECFDPSYIEHILSDDLHIFSSHSQTIFLSFIPFPPRVPFLPFLNSPETPLSSFIELRDLWVSFSRGDNFVVIFSEGCGTALNDWVKKRESELNNECGLLQMYPSNPYLWPSYVCTLSLRAWHDKQMNDFKEIAAALLINEWLALSAPVNEQIFGLVSSPCQWMGMWVECARCGQFRRHPPTLCVGFVTPTICKEML